MNDLEQVYRQRYQDNELMEADAFMSDLASQEPVEQQQSQQSNTKEKPSRGFLGDVGRGIFEVSPQMAGGVVDMIRFLTRRHE